MNGSNLRCTKEKKRFLLYKFNFFLSLEYFKKNYMSKEIKRLLNKYMKFQVLI